MPKVVIPTAFRGPTQGAAEVQVDGATVGACLDALERLHSGARALVMSDAGEVHRFVRLFVNGEPLDREPLSAPVAESDEIEIVAAIGGG